MQTTTYPLLSTLIKKITYSSPNKTRQKVNKKVDFFHA